VLQYWDVSTKEIPKRELRAFLQIEYHSSKPRLTVTTKEIPKRELRVQEGREVVPPPLFGVTTKEIPKRELRETTLDPSLKR
jgi:hypothetical protein